MARATKDEKRIENLLDALYRTHGSGVTVPMMSLVTIFGAARKVAKAGGDDAAVATAMKAEIDRVRVVIDCGVVN